MDSDTGRMLRQPRLHPPRSLSFSVLFIYFYRPLTQNQRLPPVKFVVLDFQTLSSVFVVVVVVVVNPQTFPGPLASVRRRARSSPSAREADFAREQKSHYGEEDGEHEEHVRGADHRVVGQLVRLPSHLVDIEAYGEDERRHAEQDHWKGRSGGGTVSLTYTFV